MGTNLPRFKVDDIIEILALEPNLFEDLRTEYGRNVLGLLEKIEEGFRRQDPSQIELYAHSLKSSSAVLGLALVSDICREIEEQAEQKKLPTDLFEKLKAELPRSVQELNLFERTA